MTEWSWFQYGFETYYLLLNCGFRLQPTAGTTSGVHPVPLGYSRVYVHTGKPFSAQAWLEGLRQGRSFVTTGPMLLATLDEQDPGGRFEQQKPTEQKYHLQLESISARPLDRIEIVINGSDTRTIRPEHRDPDHPGSVHRQGQTSANRGKLDASQTPGRPHITKWEGDITIGESSWIAIRSFQIGARGRVRFAHTAPWYIEVAGQPVRPRREEVEYLIERMREEIARNKDVLPEAALDEFRQALKTYEQILGRAVSGEN